MKSRGKQCIFLFLAVWMLAILPGCTVSIQKGENQQLDQYHAAVLFLNLVEGAVDTDMMTYSQYFGLEDELYFVKDGEYLTTPGMDEAIFSDFDSALAKYEQLDGEQELSDALVQTNSTAKQVISQVCRIAEHNKGKEYETDSNRTLKIMHQELMFLLDHYLEASDRADLETAKMKMQLDQQALSYTEKKKWVIQHNILQFSMSVNQVLDGIDRGAPEAADGLAQAEQALAAFQTAIQDKKQVSKEGYQETALSALYSSGEKLLKELKLYFAGESDQQLLNQEYSAFVSRYNNAIYQE